MFHSVIIRCVILIPCLFIVLNSFFDNILTFDIDKYYYSLILPFFGVAFILIIFLEKDLFNKKKSVISIVKVKSLTNKHLKLVFIVFCLLTSSLSILFLNILENDFDYYKIFFKYWFYLTILVSFGFIFIPHLSKKWKKLK